MHLEEAPSGKILVAKRTQEEEESTSKSAEQRWIHTGNAQALNKRIVIVKRMEVEGEHIIGRKRKPWEGTRMRKKCTNLF